MADPLPIPSPTFEAPPAYDYAGSDADNKLADAVQRSLSINQEEQQATMPDGNKDGSDGVTRIDEREEATAGPGGSYIPVRPLNIRRKKATTNPSTEKERPAWFNEAQLSAASSSTAQPRRRSLPVPGVSQQYQRTLSAQRLIPEEPVEDRTVPPPPFTAVDNSLDGPAYERYSNNSRIRRSASPAIVLRYAGQDVGASPPPSPPLSPVAQSTPAGRDSRLRTLSPHYNVPGSQQAVSSLKAPSPRPSSLSMNKGAPYAPPAPRLEFNPSVAYNDTKSIYGQLPVDTLKRGQSAAALYNSAVAPHMSSQTSLPSTGPKPKRYAPSITSLPEYDHRQVPQNAVGGAQQVYGVQENAASRMSFMSTHSAPMTPQFGHVAQYPQTQQYPMQHNYATSFPSPAQQPWPNTNGQYHAQAYYQR